MSDWAGHPSFRSGHKAMCENQTLEITGYPLYNIVVSV